MAFARSKLNLDKIQAFVSGREWSDKGASQGILSSKKIVKMRQLSSHNMRSFKLLREFISKIDSVISLCSDK